MERFYSFNSSDEPLELPPGFRFHPTDEELVTHYLSPKARDSSFSTKAIGEVDLNKVEPWDLPWKAKIGEKEWYFFCVRDWKYPTGSRTNRATDAGFWKATGKDKEIFRAKILVGMKKTLVFYRGRAPRGEKTNWVMHEYRLEGKNSMLPRTAKNEWVICRIFKKSSGGKKVHMSGLVSNRDYCLDLPPLADMSSDENPTRTTAAAQGSHVTCFSNPAQDSLHKSVDEYSFSSSMRFPCTSSISASQIGSCTENFHCQDSVIMQDQSILRLLLETNGPCMKQNAKADFSQDIGINADTSSAISNRDVEFKPCDEDQEFPIISTGPIEFDCLWNY